jgi:uncharacterized membrane protein
MSTVIGVFDNRKQAENTINQLRDAGFEPTDISVVMKDDREREQVAENTGASVAEGTAAGAGTGAIIGGVTGLLAGTVFPGLGILLIGGPLATALGLTGAAATTVSGAATGAVAGGLIGALTGLGLSEDDARHYERRIQEGAILLAVPTPDDLQADVEDIFTHNRVSDLTVVGSKDTAYYEEEVVEYRNRPAYATVGTKGGRTRKQEDRDTRSKDVKAENKSRRR